MAMRIREISIAGYRSLSIREDGLHGHFTVNLLANSSPIAMPALR